MNVITTPKVAEVVLTDIPLGRLFQTNDTVYLKTDHIRHTESGAVINEDHTTSMSANDVVLVVALGTGRTFYFALDMLVTRVIQETPIKVKIDG